MLTRHLFESSEELSLHQKAIVAVIDSSEWNIGEAIEQEIRATLEKDINTEHEEDNEISVMQVLPSRSEEGTPGTVLGAFRTSGINSLPQVMYKFFIFNKII